MKISSIFVAFLENMNFEEEKILKGRLDSIPSPPAKFKIMGGGSLLQM